MQPVLPTWFKQRQGKAEPAGENILKLTAPQLDDAYIRIEKAANGLWLGALRRSADGPEVAKTGPTYDRIPDAWGAAFELYREHLVV